MYKNPRIFWILKVKTPYFKKDVVVKTDRQLGTNHFKHGFMYMLNYAYIPNIISGDSEEFEGRVIANHT